MNKTCSKCGESKPLAEFGLQSSSRDGLRGQCNSCRAARQRERNTQTKDARRKYMRHKLYGLSEEQFQAMLAAQRGCCAICQTTLALDKTGLHIDHDHSTGKVRGLLCGRCNAGIGHLGDSEENLWRAALYLADSKK